MRKAPKIYAAVFAFLLAGVLGVGSAQADTPTGGGDVNNFNCGTVEEPKYSYSGDCSKFNEGGAVSQSASGSSATQQTQSTSQYQAAPQAQTDQQAAPEPKKEQKPAATEQKADDATEQSATVAGSTDDAAPVVPLWALVTLSAGILGAASYALRRVTLSQSSYPEA